MGGGIARAGDARAYLALGNLDAEKLRHGAVVHTRARGAVPRRRFEWRLQIAPGAWARAMIGRPRLAPKSARAPPGLRVQGSGSRASSLPALSRSSDRAHDSHDGVHDDRRLGALAASSRRRPAARAPPPPGLPAPSARRKHTPRGTPLGTRPRPRRARGRHRRHALPPRRVLPLGLVERRDRVPGARARSSRAPPRLGERTLLPPRSLSRLIGSSLALAPSLLPRSSLPPVTRRFSPTGSRPTPRVLPRARTWTPGAPPPRSVRSRAVRCAASCITSTTSSPSA